VALETIAVFAVDRLGVRQAVTILALGHGRMPALMTIETVDTAMQGGGTGEGIGCLDMAGSTGGCWQVAAGGDQQRLVSGMTLLTNISRLALLVGTVAVETCWNLLVLAVTAVTEQLSMATRFSIHLLTDRGMAAEAFALCRLQGIPQGEQRPVAVGVTMTAVVQLLMGGLIVALGTTKHDLLLCRRMVRVTVETVQRGRVLASRFSQVLELHQMALAAILHLQLWQAAGSSRRCLCAMKQQRREKKR